jgi:hypothetical protein
MNRAEAEAYLAPNFSELLAEVTGSSVLDDALNSFEAFVATRPEVDAVWHTLVAEYYLLVRLQRAFSPQFNVTITNRGAFELSKLFDQVSKMLANVTSRLTGIIDPVLSDDTTTDEAGTVFTVVSPWQTGGVSW